MDTPASISQFCKITDDFDKLDIKLEIDDIAIKTEIVSIQIFY